jgi:phosphatidylglycerophosphatase B
MANLSRNIPENCDRRLLLRWVVLMLLLLLALLPSYGLMPTVPAAGVMLDVCWGVSLSAGKYGLAWMGLLMMLLIQPRWAAMPALLLPVLLLIGSGAWLNEHVLKPTIAEPRPSISFLASAAAGPVLDQGVEAFYAIPDKASRSEYLAKELNGSATLQLPPLLQQHWIEETGYSFPSGHAFAATALAGWFMLVILCTGTRRWLLPLLWGWVVAVCYSRVILGVHRPGDILAGVVEGGLLVMLAVLAWKGFVNRKAGQVPDNG